MARRSFSTRLSIPDAPMWEPLEQVVNVCHLDPYLPEIAADEFMYMACVKNRRGVVIHLYKHIETRCYLNLDEGGHAYQYLGPATNEAWSGGRYQAHRSLSSAIAGLQLWCLERNDPYWTLAPEPF